MFLLDARFFFKLIQSVLIVNQIFIPWNSDNSKNNFYFPRQFESTNRIILFS
ncbi:hypothetical protein LEP1GSC062_0887 [Leptospira alexanderi serovar Manhao 3 str. L 60]|uniref:Uncharacterized protein n=1 Tax=Leptospira alexanderi serovar Manhao 3 str. L 60 TaxID=1049759 RepID=V6IFJ7_9LEPT|nr:hypothetical protein LEP1GSC062_0887 [Leptospira alexanderi serovar Manhao 3 str. L 60]